MNSSHNKEKTHQESSFKRKGFGNFIENSESKNFQRKTDSQNFFDQKIVRKGINFRFVIEPFIKSETPFKDIFDFELNEKFSMKKLIPVDRSTRRSRIVGFRNDMGEYVEDAEGYEHYGENLRMNFG